MADVVPGGPLAVQYDVCRQNAFGTFTLAVLLERLRESNRRLVLVLDEFDQFLNLPIFNSAEFFGGLRHLASTKNRHSC